MFHWDELLEIAESASAQLPVLRTVKSEKDVRSRIENYHQVPLEIAQMGACSSEEVEELCRRAQGGITTQQS